MMLSATKMILHLQLSVVIYLAVCCIIFDCSPINHLFYSNDTLFLLDACIKTSIKVCVKESMCNTLFMFMLGAQGHA